jgi:hypothetical protein
MQHSWGEEECIRGFGWKSRRKRPLGRTKSRWEGNIKMDLREIGWCVVDWIDLADDGDQWRDFMNTAMNLQVP